MPRFRSVDGPADTVCVHCQYATILLHKCYLACKRHNSKLKTFKTENQKATSTTYSAVLLFD